MAAGKIGDLLVQNGLVTEDQIQQAELTAKESNQRFISTLVQLGHVNESVLSHFLSQLYGYELVSLEGLKVEPEILELIPRNIAEKYALVPIGIYGKTLSIAVADPTQITAVDDIRFLSNMEVKVHVALGSAILETIERLYGAADSDPNQKIEHQFDEGPIAKKVSNDLSVGEKSHDVESENAQEKPVIRLMNTLLVEAIRRKASDIHLEPFPEGSRVRLRIDGVLHEVMEIPKSLRHSVPARIKVMASLDISERRLPQDGRIQVHAKNRTIDVRVSVIPTILGEKVVMRLLDQGNQAPSLKEIGYEEEQYKLFKLAAAQPHGMILVTGPTGSGKSTTLYAALSEINGPNLNISTVEDPVEYKIPGVNQVQMKEGIGLTFASALRSLLRQDPDVIMVGEIRDQETAEIAVKASLTGHLVFSTLHTNDAPSTINRLRYMGIEPFLITASVTLVQAQRLIRTNCEHCLVEDESIKEEQLLRAEIPKERLGTFRPQRGEGCERCGKTGYRGRMGVFEVMPITENLRTHIVKGSNADELKRAAMQEGMMSLRQSALEKLYRGETTLEEVLNNTRPDGDLK